MPSFSDTNKTTDKDEVIVRVAGSNDDLADVELQGGKRRLLTGAVVTVEEIFGQDPFADTWFTIDNAGILNDTFRIQIAATANDPTVPDRDAPAVDVTVTVGALEVGDEIAMRDKIITDLNNDANFSNSLKAIAVKDNAIVHISSIFRGEFWHRPNAGDFAVTTTGSAAATLGFDTVLTRGKPTELARSPDDARQGILGVSGSIQVTPNTVTDLFEEEALDGGSSDMAVDGTVPVEFFISAHATKQKVIQFMTFGALDSGIKYDKFLGRNQKITNGILVEFKSQDNNGSFSSIKSTEDFEDVWARTTRDFRITVQSSTDHVNATKDISQSVIIIDPVGTYGTDDFIKITIRDDLSQVTSLRFIAKGFLKDV